ncbi:MAG: hypothetical protein GY940_17820 [bacterium]|nr:hypothetical protein [bacterium]
MSGLFERINFFKGLFMEAGDWRKEQDYHIEKRRYHNKFLHTPGVASGSLGDLRVSVSSSGTTLVAAPGYAIDGEGRDLYVPEAREIKLPPLQAFNPPSTVYVVISYREKETEKRNSDANPDYAGYAFVAEDTLIEVTTKEPDNLLYIELARIRLSEDPETVRDAVSPDSPGFDEIDLNHVPEAGTRIVSTRKALTLSDFSEKLMDTTIEVRSTSRKQNDTNVLIEKIVESDDSIPPMYMVTVQSLDGAPTQWWIESTKNRKTSDYTLHINNDSSRTTTVVCRVFRMRV